MSKYVDRILDEVCDNFERHFTDKDERVEFVEELIEALEHVLVNVIENYEDEEDMNHQAELDKASEEGSTEFQ